MPGAVFEGFTDLAALSKCSTCNDYLDDFDRAAIPPPPGLSRVSLGRHAHSAQRGAERRACDLVAKLGAVAREGGALALDIA